MRFNSFLFIAFFLAVLPLHWALPRRPRNWLLLAASYVFYATWDVRFLGLILASTALDYVVARVIESSPSARVRKAALLTSVIGNLTLLSFFKYYNFFIESLDGLLASFGGSAAALHLDVVLPVGISFYTFQTMSYAIDVHAGRIRAVHNWVDFSLYVCFFPQLVAGPIERARDLVPQIQAERRLRVADVHEGFHLMVWGFFKKVVIADNLARVVDPVFLLDAQVTGFQALLGTIAFVFQVYADFSAYTDIARGTARLLGFRLSRNFDAPYFARDMGELWARWHITLTSWLRDYVFIPLGGSRARTPRVLFNQFLTMLLAGLWHGSNGTFIVFGLFHGTIVSFYRLWRRRRPAPEGWRAVPSVLLTMFLWWLGAVFFRGETVAQCLSLLHSIFFDLRIGPLGLFEWQALPIIALCPLPMLLYDWLQRRAGGDELFALRWSEPARVVLYVAVFYSIVLAGRTDVRFIYFQF